jgi:hypothetical protein
MNNKKFNDDIFKSKYQKYKQKYLKLCAQLAGAGAGPSPLPDLIPYEGKNILWFVKEFPWPLIIHDSKNFIWTTNITDKEKETGLINAYVAIDGQYSIPNYVFTPGQLKIIVRANPLDTPWFDPTSPYTFEPEIILAGVSTVPVNLFYNLFSDKFIIEIQDKIILNWLTKKTHQHISPETIRDYKISTLINLISQPKFKIGLIGGASDTIWIDRFAQEYPRLEILCQSMTNLCINNTHRIDKPIYHVNGQLIDQFKTSLNDIKDTKQLLADMDSILFRLNQWRTHQKYFWPDGVHPNRLGHKKLFDFIMDSGFLEIENEL